MRAPGDLAEVAGRDVHDPDVGGHRGAGENHGERLAVLREVEAEGDLARNLWMKDRLAGLQVEKIEIALAGDVPDKRGDGACVVQSEALELGVGPLGEDRRLAGGAFGGKIQPCERVHVPPGVGREIYRPSV